MSTRARALLLLTVLCAACGGGGPTSPRRRPERHAHAAARLAGQRLPVLRRERRTASPTRRDRAPPERGRLDRRPDGHHRRPAAASRCASVPNGAQTGPGARRHAARVLHGDRQSSVTVPASGDVPVPARLALGSRNRPNVYLAFGDSITAGEGSSDEQGYVDDLGAQLTQLLGPRRHGERRRARDAQQRGPVAPAGQPRADPPRLRLDPLRHERLERARSAATAFPCYTIDSLRAMIQDTKSAGAFPIVGDDPAREPAATPTATPTERNDWVRRMNDLIRQMAAQERAPVAEIYGDFMKQPSLPPLYSDFLHPNDSRLRAHRAVVLPGDHPAAARGPRRGRPGPTIRAPAATP